MPIAEIEKRNYNLDIKNPHTDEVGVADPIELLAQYEAHRAEVQSLRTSLRDVLAEALTR